MFLKELLFNLLDAVKNIDPDKIEDAYRALEQVGMDRTTARYLLHHQELWRED